MKRCELKKREESDNLETFVSELQNKTFEQTIEITRLKTQLQAHEQCINIQQTLEERLKREEEINQSLRLLEQETRINGDTKIQNLKEKIDWLQQSENRTKILFENIAQTCLERSCEKNENQQQEKLSFLLTPLREQLEIFQNQLQEKFQYESKERHLLAHELTKIQQMNQQLSQDANNLTQALLGNQKTQGSWGELLLEKTLESSGLRKGSEYKLQVSLIQSSSDQRIQPDAVVYLPEDRSVIIDSKVSLTAYARYMDSIETTCKENNDHLASHIQSLRMHIKNLSKKSYHQAKGLKTLDFVLLFVPVEAAFTLALKHCPELLQEAQSQHIMLVSPTTLLIALKTIQNLWQIERQVSHSRLIAFKASNLYDKFRLFLESFQSIGASLDRAQSEYHNGLSRLSQGKGNIFKQISSFKDLGIDIQKNLPPLDVSVASNHLLEQEPILDLDESTAAT